MTVLTTVLRVRERPRGLPIYHPGTLVGAPVCSWVPGWCHRLVMSVYPAPGHGVIASLCRLSLLLPGYVLLFLPCHASSQSPSPTLLEPSSRRAFDLEWASFLRSGEGPLVYLWCTSGVPRVYPGCSTSDVPWVQYRHNEAMTPGYCS